jgi:hypothetical protein
MAHLTSWAYNWVAFRDWPWTSTTADYATMLNLPQRLVAAHSSLQRKICVNKKMVAFKACSALSQIPNLKMHS